MAGKAGAAVPVSEAMTPILIGSPVAGPAAVVVAVDAAVVVLPAAVVAVDAACRLGRWRGRRRGRCRRRRRGRPPPHATTNTTAISNTAINPAIVSFRTMYSLPFST